MVVSSSHAEGVAEEAQLLQGSPWQHWRLWFVSSEPGQEETLQAVGGGGGRVREVTLPSPGRQTPFLSAPGRAYGCSCFSAGHCFRGVRGACGLDSSQ